MFTEMINTLREGRRPLAEDLRCRLDAAIIKKGGILQQPRACWSGDSKINPNVFHMFWAAVIIGDVDAMATIVGMIEIESLSGSTGTDLNDLLLELLSELAAISSESERSGWLSEKINSASEKLCLTSLC